MDNQKVFYLNNQKRIITDISIINTKLSNQSKLFNSEYILYIFKVVSPFNTWHIKKRYTEIKEIYDFLVKKKPKLIFPAFPPKRLFSTKEATIIERKNRFEEIFFFILQNIEILKYKKLIDFFKVKKTILVIYIKNCILVNENGINYDLIEDISSSSSNDFSNDSTGTEKDIKDKKATDSIKNQMDRQHKKKNENTKEEKKINNNINEVINNIISTNEEDNSNNNEQKENIKKILKANTNYFKCYEEFKLYSGNYTSRSQVSFFIIKELLRNLKVHSSNILEIITDFTNYIKLKNKWKKFNEKEIISLFIGINKDELYEDYFQAILKDDKLVNNRNASTTISEKSTLASTYNSNSSGINVINNNLFNVNKINNINDSKSSRLEGLLYYIGNFEANYIGSKNCLLLVNKIFERDFNPEVDIYIEIFKKIEINHIRKMNLCNLSVLNNHILEKQCFNLINIYTNGASEENQIKILNDLNANDNFINRFLNNNYIDDTKYNSYNLE